MVLSWHLADSYLWTESLGPAADVFTPWLWQYYRGSEQVPIVIDLLTAQASRANTNMATLTTGSM